MTNAKAIALQNLYSEEWRGWSEMILEYILAKECKNDKAWYTCLKCGKCGRVFDNGFMINDGGTTIEEEDD